MDGDNIHAGDITRRLKQEHIRVMEEENKLHLLTTLKKRGLSTRDIMAFIKNQADNRTILKTLDKGLASRAMTYKIRDCKSVLFVHRKNRSDLKTEYIRSTGGKKYHIRRILRSARNEYNKQDLRSKQKKFPQEPPLVLKNTVASRFLASQIICQPDRHHWAPSFVTTQLDSQRGRERYYREILNIA